MMKFKFTAVCTDLIHWVRKYFKENGDDSTVAVIGMSGGKDSTISAAVCVEAIGAERVIGVKLPQGVQSDIDVANAVCEHLGIKTYEINIEPIVEAIYTALKDAGLEPNDICLTNTPARVRTTVLSSIVNIVSGRLVNTCNLSETQMGYVTKRGDDAGDFSPLGDMTVDEVKQLGHYLVSVPEFIDKVPIAGLMHDKPDEEVMGVSYHAIDDYLRGQDFVSQEEVSIIENAMLKSAHKRMPMPVFRLTPLHYKIVNRD